MKHLVIIAVGVFVVFSLIFFPFMMFNPEFLSAPPGQSAKVKITNYPPR